MQSPDRQAIRASHFASEPEQVTRLLLELDQAGYDRDQSMQLATSLVETSRARSEESGTLDAFLTEFGLSNAEGIALMCLAESLLRVPDAATADELIAEKIRAGDWGEHWRQSESQLVNASVWGLMLAGRVVGPDERALGRTRGWLQNLTSRIGEPALRAAVLTAMKILGEQFVLGKDIESAIRRAGKIGGLYSFDMLGEGARTDADAMQYLASYEQAILAIGTHQKGECPRTSNGISVKLSALHPRFEERQQDICLPIIRDRIHHLATLARDRGLGLTLDAEECGRLELTLDIFQWLATEPSLKDFDGLGFVLQTYQKRALDVAAWLQMLASEHHRRLMVRVVKGAYWDTEIKLAQQFGLDDYPVFTEKHHTDLSFEACAARLLSGTRHIFPQLATHNAHTITHVLSMDPSCDHFEMQRLHGMGALLYKVTREQHPNLKVRTYAPVGRHKDLLPYLVRRLLENGANSSFVNRFLDKDLPVTSLLRDPMTEVGVSQGQRNSKIPSPPEIFAQETTAWRSARGLDMESREQLTALSLVVAEHQQQIFTAHPLIAGQTVSSESRVCLSPVTNAVIGEVVEAIETDADEAMTKAQLAQPDWNKLGVDARASLLERAAESIEQNMQALVSLIAIEAGRTLDDGVSEVREAVDFLRFYAANARALMTDPLLLPGPTGEDNQLVYEPRGVCVCISPWNFPLAIFIGQIAAALATGNAVVAKPAEQTPLTAYRAVQLLHEAGIPTEVLALLPGDGELLGSRLLAHPALAGVVFTGSHDTAVIINRALAQRSGAIVPLVAETGGINTMVVDSTALPEQVVDDVITSAFQSAGQRCSAMRVLLVQNDIADTIVDMLAGAMAALTLGNPCCVETDIGPVIDGNAKQMIEDYIDQLGHIGKRLAITPETLSKLDGHFVRPQVWEVPNLDAVEREIFGPILHLIRYEKDDLPDILKQLKDKDFGLTLGIHSRIAGFADQIWEQRLVGNTYVNRDMVGAVVGVNPFGGHGRSGTGPKAGGPNYLLRFVTEHTLTNNITAIGGNAHLFSL